MTKKQTAECWVCGETHDEHWEEFCRNCRDDFYEVGPAVRRLFKKLIARLEKRSTV